MYLIIIYFEVKSIIMGLDYIKLGTNIKNRRKKLGYTQKRLAELIHVSEQHISHIETAHTKPSLEVIVDIANALQTDVNNLLEMCIRDRTTCSPRSAAASLHSTTA